MAVDAGCLADWAVETLGASQQEEGFLPVPLLHRGVEGTQFSEVFQTHSSRTLPEGCRKAGGVAAWVTLGEEAAEGLGKVAVVLVGEAVRAVGLTLEG